MDAYFSGCWPYAKADDPDNVVSCTGYIIWYYGCHIGWCSKLGKKSISTAEAEYIALSQALRTIIPLMNLVEELSDVLPLYINKPDFHFRIFGYNQSCIAMT